MKWNCAFAFGTLALGWLAVAAKAVDPPPASLSQPVVPAALATDQPASAGLVLATDHPASKDSVVPPARDPEVVSVFTDMSCDPCVCECGGWHFQAGVGLYLFQPFFHEDPAFTTSIYKGTGAYDPFAKGSTSGTQTTTFTYGTQNTTNHTEGSDDDDHDHEHPHWHHEHHHHWHDDFLPPGLWKSHHDSDDDKASHQSTSTTSTSQTTTTTTTTQNTTTDPKLNSTLTGAGLTSRQDFGHHMEVSPLIWIGVANNDGLGFRARWWQLWDSSGTQVVNGDPTGATEISSANILGLSISSPGPIGRDAADVWLFHRDLHLVVWDVEATQALDVGAWSLLLTGGVRFAHLSQNYSAVRSISGPEQEVGLVVQQDTSILVAGHNFNGAGPMVSFEAHRPIADTGLLFYGTARGSLLFGTRKQNVNTEEVYAVTLADNTPFSLGHTEAATAHGDTLLPVMELEVGIEYGLPVGQFYPFIRTGLVAQVWFGAGNSSSTDGDLGFLGLEASLGVNF
jgi:hypothetical protein